MCTLSVLERPNRLVIVAFLLWTAGAAPALAQEPTGAALSSPPVTRTADHKYVIGPGDLLEVAVWDNTAISRTVPVRPDGKISIPVLHDVQAAGLTPTELREFLDKALTPFVQAPAVSVIVREVHSFKVAVIGQVKSPGRFDLAGGATVLEVLAMAGGLAQFASPGRIVILRQEGGVAREIPFAYDKLVSRNGSAAGQSNFFLQPNDIVLVP